MKTARAYGSYFILKLLDQTVSSRPRGGRAGPLSPRELAPFLLRNKNTTAKELSARFSDNSAFNVSNAKPSKFSFRTRQARWRGRDDAQVANEIADVVALYTDVIARAPLPSRLQLH